MTRVLVVMGTRPEVVKLAPVIHRLRARRDADLVVCSTGQHREMLDSAMQQFELRADHDLALMKPGQDQAELLGRLLIALRPLLAEVKPDVMLVQGDTTTVMGSALAGFLSGVRVGHVEAGLRTRDKRAPFPEEVCRRVAGVVADEHFAPTPRAASNLLAEGVDPSTVHVTGNTVVDALDWMVERVRDRPLPAELDNPAGRLVLVTAHRRESFGGPFRDLCVALREIAARFPDTRLVYPVHLNPAVRAPVREILDGARGVTLTEPLDYSTFIRVMLRADLIITDSGGIQEEAPSLGKPVLVMREVTERPEAVAAGVVKLVGTATARIVDAASTLLSDPGAYASMARRVAVYGDGRAADRIVDIVLGGRPTLPPFAPAE